LNPNYVTIVKQDIDELFAIGFIKLIEEATWLLLIVVVPRRMGGCKFVLILGSSM
jgi:hypothetical protein